MKKMLILVFCFLILLTGCGGSNKEKGSESEETQKEASIEVDKKILSVDVTLPVALVEEEGVDIETTLEEIRQTDGINKVTLNDNGTVTYNMTKSKHSEMIKSIKDSIDESSDELVNDVENSIVKIENSSDYTNFEVYVNPEKYNVFEMFSAMVFYMQGIMYNSFNGNNDAEIIVKFINNETGEIIEEGSSAAFLESSESENVSDEDVLVSIEELPIDLKILEPDSIGSVYGEMVFTNNSRYPITSFSVTTLKKDDNENSYYSSYDTVLPGEFSPKFSTFAPESGDINDVEYLEISYYVLDGDVYKSYEYDIKTKKYELWNIDVDSANDKVPVKIDELPFDLKLDPPNSFGDAYGTMIYSNNSDYTLLNYSVKMLKKDVNEITYYSNSDTVLPGETSPNFSASGPSTGDLSDIEVLGYDYQISTDEGKEYFIEYNVKTDIYTMLDHNF